MSNIENEVVSITFDNDGFQKGVAEVLSSMEDLRGSLDNVGKGDAFSGIEAAANSIDLSGIESAIDSIDSKFSALGAVAFTAIQGVTTSAVDAARNMFDNTLGQIISGGTARSLAIEQAKFRFEGMGQDIEASMQSALEAVKGTSFGLDEAATLAAAFGGAGIQAGQELTNALRGVAGVASVFGQSFADIGMIFQDVAAAGELTGAHLFSFSSRGIGMAQKLGEAWGMTAQEVKEAASNGEISFQEFAATVNTLFGDQATKANETYSGSLDNVHAAMNRLGEVFIAPKLEATRNVFNALAPVIDGVKDALLPLVDIWKVFVNIQAIKTIKFLDGINIEALEKLVPDAVRILKNLYSAIGSFLKPIKRAFKDVFPPVTADNLENIALAIKRFTRSLQLSGQTMRKVRSIFGGIFAVFSIGFEIVKNVVEVIFDVVRAFSGVGQGFLSAGAGVGDFLVALEKVLVDGGGISDFFDEVSAQLTGFIEKMKDSEVIQAFGDAISWLGESIADLFSGITRGGGAGAAALDGPFGRIGQRVEQLMGILDAFAGFIADVWGGIVDVLQPALDWLMDTFSGLGSAIADAMGEGDFDKVLDIINTALFGGIVGLFWKFLKDGATIDLTGGAMEAISGAFEQLTATFEAMQLQLKAGALMKIAQAIGILTISLVVLSLIDSDRLSKAIGAITIGFAELSTVLFGMTKMGLGAVGGIKGLLALAGAMVVVAGAMILLSIAALIFSTMDLEDLGKGLAGVGASMIGLSVTASFLAKSAPKLVTAAGSILALAGAIFIIGLATAVFAKMQWPTMLRGLFGVAAALTGITIAMTKIPADAGAKAPSLLALSISLIGVSKAVEKMADIPFWGMIKGLLGLGFALAGIVFIANQFDAKIVAAQSILMISGAMIILAFALEKIGNIPLGNLAKAIIGMALALTILAVAGVVFGALSEVILPGAGALAAMSAALFIFAVAMERLGNIDFGTFGKAILFMVGGLIALALASILLIPAILPIAALGLALLVFGAGLALVGAGIYLAAKGFEIFAQSGQEGLDAVMNILIEIIRLIPTMATELAKGIIEFVQVIVDHAPELVEGLGALLGALFDAITENAPKYGEALKTLVQTGIDVLKELYPDIIEAGTELVVKLLEGLAENVPQICDAARKLVFALYGCIIENATYLPRAAFRLVMSLTQGLRSRIGQIISTGAQMVRGLVTTVVNNARSLISSGAQAVGNFISGIAQRIGSLIGRGREFVSKLINGIANKAGELVQQGVAAIGSFLSGIAIGAVNLFTEGLSLAGDIIEGIVNGIRNGLSSVVDAISDMAGNAIDAAKGLLGIGSPSRVFADIGDHVVRGFAQGIDKNGKAIDSVKSFGDSVVATMLDTAKELSDSLDVVIDQDPTITPVLDLSKVKSQAKDISSLVDSNPVNAGLSFSQARLVADLARPTDDTASETSEQGPRQVTFEQTIIATTPLSPGEIYRQTKSQITMAKEELEVA